MHFLTIIMNCALESEVQIAKTGVLAKLPKRYIIGSRETTANSPANGFFDDESCLDDSQGFNSDFTKPAVTAARNIAQRQHCADALIPGGQFLAVGTCVAPPQMCKLLIYSLKKLVDDSGTDKHWKSG